MVRQNGAKSNASRNYTMHNNYTMNNTGDYKTGTSVYGWEINANGNIAEINGSFKYRIQII